ncbi:ankyrin repeat-containing protein NPR4 [Lactuca sativa]|uniref:PGG domain-containing protein n=1 Tax=Lactuca sativa TaxID=4236 RepID=A0A9R1VUM1_LACSA|nr:ankyrin repeat-containing protein NPR4 [Lactuca sativa]KAJ0211844.1 hypothetical protein LSAT_V11C400197030 [Lactuca sativa]
MVLMDWVVTQAIINNDTTGFRKMVEEDEHVVDKRMENATVLHLASRLGHVEMVSLILELRPQMVTEENNINSETPIHEACRMGQYSVVRLLMEANKWMAAKLNSENQSALFLACDYGHLNIVNFLLDHTYTSLWLLNIFDHAACLYAAASRGQPDIAKRLLERCPNLANQKDRNGSLALHGACRSGQLEITSMLLRMDSNYQAFQFDNSGYTPLHVAAIHGKLAILEEFASVAPSSFQTLSKHGENLFHLTIRFNQFDAFKFVGGVLKGATYMFYQPDRFGNTIQHLAHIGGLNQFSEYINRESEEKINHQIVGNHRGILYQTELPTTSMNLPEIHFEATILDNKRHEINRYTSLVSQTTEQEEKHIKAHKKNPKKQNIKLQQEALQNARRRITIVAILIASIAFTNGLNPPRGVYQGNSVMGKKRAFKIFAISNHIAFFASLCIVAVLVGVIRFRRKPLKLILAAAYMVTWVAFSFMVVSCVAAIW